MPGITDNVSAFCCWRFAGNFGSNGRRAYSVLVSWMKRIPTCIMRHSCHTEGRKNIMSHGKPEIDGEVWLLNDPYNVDVLNIEKCYSFHHHELFKVGS